MATGDFPKDYKAEWLPLGDRVRHIAINGGVENGGMDIAFEKCADDDPSIWRLLTRGENGEPVWTRVKWTISKAENK